MSPLIFLWYQDRSPQAFIEYWKRQEDQSLWCWWCSHNEAAEHVQTEISDVISPIVEAWGAREELHMESEAASLLHQSASPNSDPKFRLEIPPHAGDSAKQQYDPQRMLNSISSLNPNKCDGFMLQSIYPSDWSYIIKQQKYKKINIQTILNNSLPKRLRRLSQFNQRVTHKRTRRGRCANSESLQ